MKTSLLLFAQYEKPLIPLDDICKEYLGLSPREARRALAQGELGVKAIQLRATKNAPWYVHIDDLADFVDSLRRVA